MPDDHEQAPPASLRAFAHAMLGEIFQQPATIQRTLQQNVHGLALFPGQFLHARGLQAALQRLTIVASGSSRHAGALGRILIGQIAGISTDIVYASEYARCNAAASADGALLALSQSGRSLDTLEALRHARRSGQYTIAMANVRDSPLFREADEAIHTAAGVEVAIPATKSVMGQLVAQYLLAFFLARQKGLLEDGALQERLAQLAAAARLMEQSLPRWDDAARECAAHCQGARSFLFLGRGVHYPLAREGALKLKECAYIGAEGLPAGELLHGSSALVDQTLAVVLIATRDEHDAESMLAYAKNVLLCKRVKDLGGRIVAIVTERDRDVVRYADRAIFVPRQPELISPLMELPTLQLLAYHSAVLSGSNVDRPRNLEKAVVGE